MTSIARGIRLPKVLGQHVSREAERTGRSWSAMIQELLTEAIRARRAPGIAFADGPAGRRAVIAGTGLDIWEVIATWKGMDGDYSALQQSYPWLSEPQLRAALSYYQLFPEEVDARLEVEESWTPERLREEFPFTAPHKLR